MLTSDQSNMSADKNIAECTAGGEGQTPDPDTERDQLLGKVADLESKLRAVSAERDQHTGRAAELESKLRAASAERDDLESKLCAVSAERDRLVRKEEEAVEQNDELKNRVIDLESKLTTACDDRNTLVKYCGKMGQSAHQHAQCEARVAELLDETLFNQPPPEECPICFLPHPLRNLRLTNFYPCCGKVICAGCSLSIKEEQGGICPYCRAPATASNQKILDRLNKRIAANDALALHHLGGAYLYGSYGLQQDSTKAMKLWMRGAELGSTDCHYAIGLEYHAGDSVEKDLDKAKYHFQIAAVGGHVAARHILGIVEVMAGRMDRAMKHYMIAARAGHDESMGNVWDGYRRGHVAKDDLEATIRDNKDSQDAMKSESRDRAVRNRGA